jgi:drug/metabolite transporter (DMT)-like permease
MPAQGRWIGFVCLGITAVGWALNWPAIKFLLREWPPLFSRGVAGVAASLILFAIACARREPMRIPSGAAPRLLFATFTNVFAWMGFSTVAMKWVSVGEGALIVYTMPIWATLFAWPLLGARPTLRDIAALLLGIAGIVLLFGGHHVTLDHDKSLGIALALGSAIFFALGNVLNKKPIALPAISLVAWQVGLGCFAMLILGLVFEKPVITAISLTGFTALAYMTIVSMGICYLTWFETLRRLPAPTASTGMLLVPVIGVTAASLMLGEPLGVREWIAMALTLGGVTLALQKAN